MLNAGKKSVLGILIDAVDYDAAVQIILDAARKPRSLTVSALAVHGLMTGVLDSEHKFRLNHFDLLVPDGQPVRWVLNLLYHARQPDRVYGPNLTLRVCACAAVEKLPVYFYGSTQQTLAALRRSVEARFPGLVIAGTDPSKFRRLSPAEKNGLVERIRRSGASIVFVGLGCPRQEIFAYEFQNALQMPLLAVGAAFPFLAGTLPQAPAWMQNAGLEWAFRLRSEPRRLWRRYAYLNPAYAFLVALQALGLLSFSTDGQSPRQEMPYG